jgi:hypothetical protein
METKTETAESYHKGNIQDILAIPAGKYKTISVFVV